MRARKTKGFNLFRFPKLLLLGLSFVSIGVFADPPKSAFDTWSKMVESSYLNNPLPVNVNGTESAITFGAEKEGHTSEFTRILGPKVDRFRKWVNSVPEEQRTLFLRDFLDNWSKGNYQLNDVKDLAGNVHRVDIPEFKRVNFKNMNSDELMSRFEVFLQKTGDQSFSYITPSIREKIYNGDLPGLKQKVKGMGKMAYFKEWTPLYGLPEKYISGATSSANRALVFFYEGFGGWEIQFKPQNTYTEHNNMVDWFKGALANKEGPFEAPGHFRIVTKKPANFEEIKPLYKELYKNLQAYIALKGVAGATNLEVASFKQLHPDEKMNDLETYKGVLRLEDERFGEGTTGVELRSGTKTDATRRFSEEVVASRFSSGDFSGLVDGNSWELIPKNMRVSAKDLVERFGVDLETANRAIKAFKAGPVEIRGRSRVIDKNYWIPFWNWEDAPYLGAQKKSLIKNVTKHFIETLGEEGVVMKGSDIQQVMRDWIGVTGVVDNVENYIKPKPKVAMDLEELMKFKSPNVVKADVNAIDMGIEYTARFPLRYRTQHAAVVENGKKVWVNTIYDLTREERAEAMNNVAKELSKKMGGTTPIMSDAGGHGHGIGMDFHFKDGQGRGWRVEWDGINRNYQESGEMIESSIRGGHMEIVTPKYTPTAKETKALYEVLSEQGLLATGINAGGGHISIDLAAFEGRPKAMARFLSTFHENRGVMSLMFQSPNRMLSSEPTVISEKLSKALKNFNGSEEELKQLLYNEHYFNGRFGRKSQYSQLNMTGYFQDVIPAENIHADFDLKNDVWRPNFDVNPKIRKMEFRMFNGPATEEESALQIKLVRAMLDHALNSEEELSGAVQTVDHAKYLEHPKDAYADVDHLCEQLKLDPKLYRPMVSKGLTDASTVMSSAEFKPWVEKTQSYQKLHDVWGEAVAARSKADGIKSSDRPWVQPEELSAEQLKQIETRKANRLEDAEVRNSTESDRIGLKRVEKAPVVPTTNIFRQCGDLIKTMFVNKAVD